ncbi:MAG: DUF72 domain-containing protein [Verrucomicrobia bacterium]|nr:MAG: DUF72 domain-containing protein [Verrucomicrobiota bacterium]
MVSHAYIGTSGWNYKSWRKSFYGETPQKQWLRFYAKRFNAIEVNGTFYRLQEKSTFKKWRDETPEGFSFTIKGHRYVTHNKKLLDAQESVIRCRESASPLGKRLAAVVWQLPSFLKKDADRLEKFLHALHHWKTTRHAIEFRHKSWFDDEVSGRLRRHAVAVCMSDAPDWPMWEDVTTDLVYIRLHGHTRKYASSYSNQSLRKWAARIECWLDENRTVHVYFDNDAEGAAPQNALTLLQMLGRSEREVA